MSWVRVLVVDDYEQFRRAAAAVVESLEGFRVLVSAHEAADVGAEAAACGAAGFVGKSSFGADPLHDAWLAAVG